MNKKLSRDVVIQVQDSLNCIKRKIKNRIIFLANDPGMKTTRSIIEEAIKDMSKKSKVRYRKKLTLLYGMNKEDMVIAVNACLTTRILFTTEEYERDAWRRYEETGDYEELKNDLRFAYERTI